MTEERPNPLAQHRAAMKQALDAGGGQAVIDYVEGFDSDPLRRVLYIASTQVLAPPDFKDKRLDDLITVSDAGIVEMLRQVEAAEDDETRGQCLHAAHVVSFNLAAELADCWPGDDLPRTKAHHERGVQAATDCLLWSELAGVPRPISTDYWVRGIHQLALGDVKATIRSWTAALEFAETAAENDDQSKDIGPAGTFAVILNSGYLGLARWISGEDTGQGGYETAIGAFRAQSNDAEKAEEAKVGFGQLEKTRKQHGP
jgi:hypothetical protein